jgi:hypothetical protein
MAGRLLVAGYDVTVYNRHRHRQLVGGVPDEAVILLHQPATAAARRVCAAECVREASTGQQEDFSAVIRAMEHKGGVKA